MTDDLKISKGDLVTFKTREETRFHSGSVYGYRRMSDAEVTAWYDAHRGQMRDDGESYITDGWAAVKLEGVYRVARARVAPCINWYKQKGMLEVVAEDGTTVYAKRSHIAAIA